MKFKYMIKIFLLFSVTTIMLSACSTKTVVNPICLDKMEDFDNDVEGEVVAKLLSYEEECLGGNMGHGCTARMDLKGQLSEKHNQITVSSGSGGEKSGGTLCEGKEFCIDYINNMTKSYGDTGCFCSSDLVELRYSCECEIFEFSESFRSNLENESRYYSSKSTDIKLRLNELILAVILY
ncbi:hypothetical protein HOK76_07615 [archaeon]|jgi:hypothetical protein|nr:hypothetical protein [archaeon]